MARVPVTEEERKSPYFKYFDRPLATPPQEFFDRVEKQPLNPKTALRATEINRLFDDGYIPDGEFGFCTFEDGTSTMANLTPMPGVTVEMFDWWFAWHGLEPMRYKMWCNIAHEYCLTRNPEQALDRSLSMKERYWDTIHDVREKMFEDGPTGYVAINFRNPADVGFDQEKLKNFKGTIVTAGNEENPVIMCHFVRPTADGVELRTRFWFGWCYKDGRPQRYAGNLSSPVGREKLLYYHNIAEFYNLYSMLPELYAEFAPDFK